MGGFIYTIVCNMDDKKAVFGHQALPIQLTKHTGTRPPEHQMVLKAVEWSVRNPAYSYRRVPLIHIEKYRSTRGIGFYKCRCEWPVDESSLSDAPVLFSVVVLQLDREFMASGLAYKGDFPIRRHHWTV